MDAYQHVNNAIYLNYLEEARDQVMVGLFGEESYDFVLVHIDIDFRSEVTLDDEKVIVSSRVADFGSSSVRTREVVTKADGTLAAEAGAVSVPRDRNTGRSRRLDEHERDLLAAELSADRAAGHVF